MLAKEPILVIFCVVLFLYFVVLSIKFPMICAAIYPFTFLSFTQIMFSVGGISPSKYIGLPLIIVGLIYILEEFRSKDNRNYSLLAFFGLLTLFPIWILIRFLLEGSEINLILTLMLNVLTTFSIVVIVNSEKRKKIMEISLGATFVLLSLSMIAAHFFPSIHLLRSIQEGEYSRTIGMAIDPNFGGAFIAIGFIYFFSKSIHYHEAKRKGLFYWYLLLLVISIVGLGMTLSRAAILSVVVCTSIMILWGRIKIRNVIWLAVLIISSIVVVVRFPASIEGIIYRFSIASTDYSNIARLEIFQRGMHAVENNMLIGIGQLASYHNVFIDIAASSGIIGLLSFALIIVVVFMMNVKIMISTARMFQETARFVVFGLFVIVFNGMFIGMEQERIVWFLFGWGIINFILYSKAHPVEKTTPAFATQLNLESNHPG